MNPAEIQRIGPYRVKRFVAEGGMAWVFLVVDPRFETHEVLRALKLLKPEAAAGEEFERFRQEAGLLAGIDHPNLVTIFDFGKDDATGCFYYTMTFVDGPSMSQRVREGGKLEEGEAIRLFADLLSGLAELHRRQIVHRDIKPANVLIGSDGRARVSDLGIARSERGVGRTRTGTAVGTVLYMSPEQARGREVGAPSDVFSAGLTLYEALTGRVVYDAVGDIDSTSSYDVLGYLVHLSRSGEEIEVDFTAGGAISKRVADVIRKACRFAPEDRFANAGEMREALLAARTGTFEVPAGPPSRLWLGVAAGVVLLGLAGVGFWYWQARARELAEQRSARDQVAEAKRLDGLVPALIERARDLPAPPGSDLLEAVDDRMRSGRAELAEAEKALDQQKFEITSYQAPRARDEYAGACRQLVAGYLGARSDADAARARARAESLRQAGAPEHLADAWKAFEKRLPGLEAPTSADCDLASAQLDRIAAASAVLSDAQALEGEMKAVWPRLAEAAQDKAERQRELAKSEVADAAEYAQRVSEANEAWARGLSKLKEADYLLARDAFDSAAKGYEDAAAIVPAAKLRAQVRNLEEEIARGPGFDPGRASLLVADADRQFLARAYPDAARIYQEALDEMKKGMQDAGRKRVAEEARLRARVAREAAAKDGAEKGDAARMANGDQALQAGEKEIAAGAFDRAEANFKEAETAFSDARKGSIEALADARDLERTVRESLSSCTRAESDTARELCASAQRDLDAATSALAERQVQQALRALRSAEGSVAQAASAERQYVDTKEWEPRIDKRTPQRAELEVYRGDLVKLAVEASDQNKTDQLRYSWRFDGPGELSPSGARAELRPKGPGTAVVLVEDGRGGRAETEWKIALGNRKPTVSVTPSQSSLNLEVGKEQLFTATLEDPDGDEMTAQWKLGGEQVGVGDTYRFVADRPGPHRLALIVTDSGGAARVVERSIQVSSPKPLQPPAPPVAEKKVESGGSEQKVAAVAVKPPPPPPPPPPAPASGGGVVVPASLGIDPQLRGQIEQMFERYRQAVQQRDIDGFRDVWVKLDFFEESLWKGYFNDPRELDVRIVVKKVIQSGDETLDVLFERTLLWDGKPAAPSTFGAKLIGRSSTGDWQIAKASKSN